MKRRILWAGLSVLAACTSVTDVNSTQDGHLMVTSRARWDIVSWNRVRNAGLKEAQAYCRKRRKISAPSDPEKQRKRRKELYTVEIHSEGLRGVTPQKVEVVFDCI